MENKRKICFVWTVVICLWMSTPAYAGADDAPFSGDFETSYIIDFLDYDGNILDSRLCAYGEKIENVVVPKREQDERYIYEFAGWEPQLSEIATECMVYTAVYRKIAKEGVENGDTISESDVWEAQQPSMKGTSNGLFTGEMNQVSDTSYDVTTFHVGTSGKETEVPKAPGDEVVDELIDPMVEESEDEEKPVTKLEEDFFSGNVALQVADSIAALEAEINSWQTVMPQRVEPSPAASNPQETPIQLKGDKEDVKKVRKSDSGTKTDTQITYVEEEVADPVLRAEETSDKPDEFVESPSVSQVSEQDEPEPMRASMRVFSVPVLLSGIVVCCSRRGWFRKQRKGKVEK